MCPRTDALMNHFRNLCVHDVLLGNHAGSACPWILADGAPRHSAPASDRLSALKEFQCPMSLTLIGGRGSEAPVGGPTATGAFIEFDERCRFFLSCMTCVPPGGNRPRARIRFRPESGQRVAPSSVPSISRLSVPVSWGNFCEATPESTRGRHQPQDAYLQFGGKQLVSRMQEFCQEPPVCREFGTGRNRGLRQSRSRSRCALRGAYVAITGIRYHSRRGADDVGGCALTFRLRSSASGQVDGFLPFFAIGRRRAQTKPRNSRRGFVAFDVFLRIIRRSGVGQLGSSEFDP